MRTVSKAGDAAAERRLVATPPPIPREILYWYGNATGSWWAIVPVRHGSRLVEAISEDALAAVVDWHLRSPV